MKQLWSLVRSWGTVKQIAAIRALLCWLALTPLLHAQQYVFHTYRQPDGLKNLAIRGMAKDRDGFLWLATENGVFRFLGAGFERFGSDQGIGELIAEDVVADENGTVWVGTDENLYRWDGNRFHPSGSKPIPVHAPLQMAVEDSRHLLVIEHGVLYRLEHDGAEKMLSFAPVFSDELLRTRPELSRVERVNVVSESAGLIRIWIASGKRLYSFPGGKRKLDASSVAEWGREQGLAEDHWAGILLDHKGTLWAGGQTHIAVLAHGRTRFVERNIPDSAQETIYRHAPFLEDREGRVLVAAQEGVARWEGAGWRSIGTQNGLQRSSQTVGMAFDADGDLWLGCGGEGLVGWSGYEDWEGWSYNQGLPSQVVWAIAPKPDGRVVVGTEDGLALIDTGSGKARPLSTKGKWPFGEISTLNFMQDGSLLAGTYLGEVLRIDPVTGHAEMTGRVSDFVMSVLEDQVGKVFFSTKRGIYVRAAKDTHGTLQPIPEANALMGNSLRVEASCESAGGSLWFLANNRLLREQNGVWSVPPVDGLSGMRGSLLSVSCSKDESIWITGGQAGTWHLVPKGGRMEAIRLQMPTDLRTLSPLAILEDRRGWIWLGTDLGLVVWNGQSWRHLSQESGLIWNDVNQNTLREAPDGSLWVGTSNGVAHLMHPERVFNSTPLSVSVTGISRLSVHDPTTPQITLAWSSAPLDFQLSSPSTRNRSELFFAYRLRDLQPDWIENQTGLAVFSGLPPGNYALEAFVQNPSLGSRSNMVTVHLTILAPWWKSTWFHVFCVLALLLLLFLIHRLYERHLRARSRELESLVRERTRELEMSREQLRIQATHDGLTGMLNRGAILRALGVALERARREDRTLVVALVDLDLFKEINDTHGHLAGDASLRWFAAAVGAAIRPYDFAGRYGGEEFLLVLPEIPRDAVESRLASLHAAITNLKVHDRGLDFVVNCSVGATVLVPAAGKATTELLLTIADHALYEAKAQGRNRVVFHYSDDPVVRADAGISLDRP